MSNWFDPTTVSTGDTEKKSAPEVSAPAAASVSETQPLTTVAQPDPASVPTLEKSSNTGTESTDLSVDAAEADSTETPAAPNGGARRRKLLISIAAVAAVTGFLVIPRGDGYTPSIPFLNQQTQVGEEAAALPTAAEAAQIDQVAAQETYAATGNYDSFTPVSTDGGSSTWLTSSESLVVFRETPEGTCLLYGNVDGTPTDVQSHSSSACTETSVQAVATQLSTMTGQPTRQRSSQGSRNLDVGTDAPRPAVSDASATDTIMMEGLKAQNYALKTGSFVGYSANGVVVMEVSDSVITLTTDARSGCPAVAVDVNNVTPIC